MTAARRARAFVATVVPASVERIDGPRGPYTLMRGATVSREGRDDLVRTVMAFGAPNQRVSHMLAAGEPVELAMRFDGGTLRVVGLPRTATGPDAAATDADPQERTAQDAVALASVHVPGTPYAETAIRTVVAVLAAHGIEGDDAAAIAAAMAGGEPQDRPSDDETPYDPDVIEAHGHLLLPLVDAGVDHAEALEIAAAIVATPASAYLADMATLRTQTVAREFVAPAA